MKYLARHRHSDNCEIVKQPSAVARDRGFLVRPRNAHCPRTELAGAPDLIPPFSAYEKSSTILFV